MKRIYESIIIICIIIIICFNIYSNNLTTENKLKARNNLGYSVGFPEGKSNAEKEYIALLEKKKNEFETKLKNDKQSFEEQVLTAYRKGFQEGEEKMMEDISSLITIKNDDKKVKQKRAKKNWNEVISTNGE